MAYRFPVLASGHREDRQALHPFAEPGPARPRACTRSLDPEQAAGAARPARRTSRTAGSSVLRSVVDMEPTSSIPRMVHAPGPAPGHPSRGERDVRRRVARTSRGRAAPAACSTGSAGRRRPRARSGPRRGRYVPAATCRPVVASTAAPRSPRPPAGPAGRRPPGSTPGRAARRSASGSGTRTAASRVDDLAGALPPEQLPFQQVLLAAASHRGRSAEPPVARSCASSPSRTQIVLWNDERTDPCSASQFHPPSSSCSPRRR